MDTTSLQNEFATWENAFGYSPSAFLGYLPDPDPVLRKLGNEAELINNLLADDQVTMAIASRKGRVLNNQRYEIRPNPKCDEFSLKASENTVKRLIEDLENTVMYDCISTILNAPFFGYSVLEVKWEARDGWWHIAGLSDKPWHWFAFDDKEQLTFRSRGGIYQPVPEGKCIVTRHFPTYENPYGLRLLSRCYWPVAFKRGGIQFYVKFVEKYGIPWPIGTAAPGATEGDKSKMAADLRRMVSDAAAVIPHGSAVEIVQPGSDTHLHENFLARWDAAISKVLMGQTLTAEVGSTGSYAAAKTHLDVAEEAAAGDRHLVTTAFNELSWIYNKLNSPACLAPVFSYIEDKDLKERVKLDKELYAMGVRFNKSYYEATYQIPAEHFEVVEPEAAQPGFAAKEASSFAVSEQDKELENFLKIQEEIDEAAEKLMPEFFKTNDPILDAIKEAISNAKDENEAQINLNKILEDDKAAHAMAVALQNGTLNASLAGYVGKPVENLNLSLKPRDALDFWLQKVPVSDKSMIKIFNTFDKNAESRAFTAARLKKFEEVVRVKDALGYSIEHGLTFKDFKIQLNDIIEANKLEDWHLRTVFNTNIQSAYQAGRYKQMQSAKKTRPYWRYVAIHDGRTRPEHAALDKVIYPADDPFWDVNYPPNGFNCRCAVVSVSESEAQKAGYEINRTPEGDEPKPINEAFSNNPAKDWMAGLAQKAKVDFVNENGKIDIKDIEPESIRELSKELLIDDLPDTLSKAEKEEVYRKRFFEVLGQEVDKRSTLIIPHINFPVRLDNNLLRDHILDTSKVDKGERGKFMRILAECLKAPDEIWLTLDRSGRECIRLISLYRYENEDKIHACLSAFTLLHHKAPYMSSSTHPRKAKGIDAQREGILLWESGRLKKRGQP